MGTLTSSRQKRTCTTIITSPPVEWSVIDPGAYMTMAHAMLACLSYDVRSDPYHGGAPPPWQNLELVHIYVHI